MNSYLTLTFMLLFSSVVFSQTNDAKKKAYDFGMEAIKLMDNGDFDKSISLLEKSCELDPENYNYPFELGYAYYLKKDYGKSIDIYEKAVKLRSCTDQCYQMLGNAYDMNKQGDQAIAAYKKGLEKFPQSGRLYLELGNMYQNDWNKALEFYEKGIDVNPEFPSNYYWATKIFCNSTEEMWGMLYGEIFMNIERGTKRTEEISKLLFDTYFSQIQFTSDTSFTVSFCQNPIVYSDKKKELPFSMIYEPSLMFATLSEDTITIESLNRIRERFINFYEERSFYKSHPNIIFDWHKNLLKEDQFECYNYWLLMQGSPNEFNSWHQSNKVKFDNFIKWFNDNPMTINEKNKFHRFNY